MTFVPSIRIYISYSTLNAANKFYNLQQHMDCDFRSRNYTKDTNQQKFILDAYINAKYEM